MHALGVSEALQQTTHSAGKHAMRLQLQGVRAYYKQTSHQLFLTTMLSLDYVGIN